MSMKKNGAASAVQYEFPDKRKETFKEMIYNQETGSILGRTGAEWGKLLIFYTIFYAILAIMFAICMQGLLASISDDRPTYVLDRSLIGTNPGLGYRPLANLTELGSVVHYNSKRPDEIKFWTDHLDEFLATYSNKSGGSNEKICDFDTKLNRGDVCAVTLENFGPCNRNQSYGYDRSKPCFFLKLNKIMEWVPEYYEDVNDLPEDMPEDLKTYVKSIPAKERKQIWVSCQGHHPNDMEIIGPVSYYPGRGFAGYYYPYTNQPGYLSPIVAVQLERPTLNQMVHIECRAWAKNIIYDGSLRDRQGSVLFEVLID